MGRILRCELRAQVGASRWRGCTECDPINATRQFFGWSRPLGVGGFGGGLLAGLLLPAALHSRAAAATVPTVRLACPIAPKVGRWASLRVYLPPTASQPMRVSVRDDRGGPAIIRTILPGHKTALFPLVFLQPNNLSAGLWPIRLAISTPLGQNWSQIVAVLRPQLGSGRIPIATLRRTRQWLADLGSAFQPSTFAAMPISMRQLLHTPVLALAGCRYVLLDSQSLNAMPLTRALALLSANLVLIYHGTTPPRRFQQLLWKPLPHGNHFWLTPFRWGLPPKPLPVVVWRLGQTHLPPVKAPRAWNMLLWACIPVGLMLILFTRLATSRPWVGLGLLLLIFLVFAAAATAWLTRTGPQLAAQCRWISQCVPGQLARTSQLDLAGWPRAQILRLTAQGPLPPLPLTASPQQWFDLHGHIHLTPSGGSLELFLPPDALQPVLRTRVQIQPGLPRRPAPGQLALWRREMRLLKWHPRRCAFMVGGRMFPVTNPRREMAFDFWLSKQPPAMRADLRCWFALNFASASDYLLEVSRKSRGYLRIINFLAEPAGGHR